MKLERSRRHPTAYRSYFTVLSL